MGGLTRRALAIGARPTTAPAAADNAIEPPPRHRDLEVHLQPYATLPDASTDSAYRDRITSGEARYQVIGRDPQGRIINGAACSIPN